MGGRVKCLAAVTKLVGTLEGGDVVEAVEASPLLGYLGGYMATGSSAVAGLALMLTDLLLRNIPSLATVPSLPIAPPPVPARPPAHPHSLPPSLPVSPPPAPIPRWPCTRPTTPRKTPLSAPPPPPACCVGRVEVAGGTRAAMACGCSAVAPTEGGRLFVAGVGGVIEVRT